MRPTIATLAQKMIVCTSPKLIRLVFQQAVPTVAIRWVLIRDPQRQFDPQALLCTDQQAQAQAILQWFVLR